MDGKRQPSFACRQPGCSCTFTSLDRLVRHASKEHFLANAAKGAALAAAGASERRRKPGAPLLSALSDRAAGMATPVGAVATFGALATAHFMRCSIQTQLQEVTHDAVAGGFLDMRPSGYVSDDVTAFLDGLGGKGSSLYVRLQAAQCLALAPLSAIALSILCTVFLSKLPDLHLKKLNLVPFLLPLNKSVEATLLISLMSDYASGAPLAPQKVAIAALATVTKMRVVFPIIVGLTLSLGVAVPARWVLHYSERQFERQAQEWVEELAESDDDEDEPRFGEEGIGLHSDAREENGEDGKGEIPKSPLAKKTE